jgi:hypothetical protein
MRLNKNIIPGARGRVLVPVVLAVLATVGPAASRSAEDWSVITIAGVPVGYVVETQAPAGPGGAVVTTSEMKMVLNRLGNRVEIALRSRNEETAEGRLVKVDYEMKASLLATKSEAVVKDGRVEIRSEAGGQTYTRTVEYAGELLGPEGIRLLSERRLKKPGDAVEFQTFVAEAGAVTKGSRKALARETVMVGGRDVPALKVEEMLDVAGVKSTAWIDDGAGTVKAEMSTPFGLAEIVKADRETALAALAGGRLPAEMYERSILRTNIRLPKARDLEYLRVRLIHKSPDEGWPEIDRPNQKVVAKTRDVLRLEVSRPAVPKPAVRPARLTAANREFLVPNEYVQSDLVEVGRLAGEVVGAETDAYLSAQKLVRWVAENMTFDLGIAFAPAGELFKNRRGTCVGYATLLAALTRAAGIPSRVVMGYIYALGMFGGHAWTEVLIGDAWVPLDPTIVSAGVADAARVAFAASSLAEGVGGLTAGAAARLFGQVDLKVEAFALSASKTVEVPPDAKAYEMASDVYRNPWLGLEVKKPAGFAFAGADAVWPDPTLLSLEGPGGVKVELQEYTLLPWKDFSAAAVELFFRLGVVGVPVKKDVGNLKGLAVSGTRKAALALADSPAAWLVVVSGENVAAVLDRLGGAISFRK